MRNTKIVHIINALADYGITVSIYDPWANPAEVNHEYGLEIITKLPTDQFYALVLGFAYKEFNSMDFNSIRKKTSVLYDVKGILGEEIDGILYTIFKFHIACRRK